MLRNRSSHANPAKGRIAIIGGGSIGMAFAITFMRAGYPVRLHEPDAARRALLPDLVLATLTDLYEFNLLDESPYTVLKRLTTVSGLAEATDGAIYVQECVPEKLDLKRTLFAKLDRLTPPDVILASASSALTTSAFAADLQGRARILVVHPGNPPFLIPVAEVVPAPFTSADIVERTKELLSEARLVPILVKREVEGFVFNRLQGAMLREAYCLVRDGVASVDDIDRIVRDGLGLRWSVIGPFETVDLNTQGGISAHAEKMGPAYARMGAERGQHDPWTADLVAQVSAARRAQLPLAQWEQRVAWRDRSLMSLIRYRNNERAE